jgi:DNA-binding PadR family transcriptional regulator
MRDVEAKSGGIYRASAGAICPTLQQLEGGEFGYFAQSKGRRVYRLNEAGKAELGSSAAAVQKILERAQSWGQWAPWMGSSGAIVARPAVAVMKAAMRAASRAEHSPEKIAKIRDILERTRKDIENPGLEARSNVGHAALTHQNSTAKLFGLCVDHDASRACPSFYPW